MLLLEDPRSATSPICRDLGIDADFSNILHDVDGILSGKVGGDMMFDYSKGDMLLRLHHLHMEYQER